MRVLLVLALAGCGRISFNDATTDARADARPDAVDASSNGYPATVLGSAPAVYFRLGEIAGGTVFDSSGNGHDGIFTSFPGSTLDTGQPGALTRDDDGAMHIIGDGNVGPGGDAAVELDPTFVDWSGDFSVELFISAHADPAPGYDDTVFLCERYLASGFRIGWTLDKQLEAWTDQGGGTSKMTTVSTFPYDTFMHVVLVHRGTSFELYRNGTLEGQQAVDYVPVGSDAECGFGAFHGMPTDATYDELALYDRALGADEILAHASAR